MEFYWAPFLVESNSDDPKIHSIQHRIIKADTIGAHAENWRGVDYLVFNTYMWWMNTLDMKVMYVTFPGRKGRRRRIHARRADLPSFILRTYVNRAGDRAPRAGRSTTRWCGSKRTGRC